MNWELPNTTRSCTTWALKKKNIEVYFLEQIKDNKLLPFFEKLFNWDGQKSFNNIALDKKYPVEKSDVYCKKG